MQRSGQKRTRKKKSLLSFYLFVAGLPSDFVVGNVIPNVGHFVKGRWVQSQGNRVPSDSLNNNLGYIGGVYIKGFDFGVVGIKLPHSQLIFGRQFEGIRRVCTQIPHNETVGIDWNFLVDKINPGCTSTFAVLEKKKVGKNSVTKCSCWWRNIGKYIKEIQIEVESSKYTYDYIRASKKGSTQLSEKRTLEEMHHETWETI